MSVSFLDELLAGIDTSFTVPNVIEFVTSPQYLDRPNLYPRQATLLKVMFLQSELFTDYDLGVIDEWTNAYIETADEKGEGNRGIVTDIHERIRINRQCPCGHDRGVHVRKLRAESRIDKGVACEECECSSYAGRRWFREVVSVIGRRGSKGHVGALAGSYVLWNYLQKGDVQRAYGIDRDKRLTAIVFGGKKEQAKANQWRDLTNVVIGAPCFTPYISRVLGESLTVMSRTDRLRVREREERGIQTDSDPASFEIVPRESTLIAARGVAAFMQFFDEAAHVVKGVANTPAEAVYEACLDPETRVLYSGDLTWRRIGDVEVGDKLVAYDEFPVDGNPRKMREAEVLGVYPSLTQPYRVTFEDGSSVVCSGNHRWLRGLMNKDGQFGQWDWKSIEVPSRVGAPGLGNPTPLRVGDYVRWIVDPWDVDDSREAGYLSAIFDGEGWMMEGRSYRVSMCQKPGVVLDQTMRYLKEKDFDFKLVPHNGRSSDVWQVHVSGLADSLRLLGQIRPSRFLERHRGFWVDRTPRGRVKAKRIVSIEPEGEPRELLDIQTSTGTFLAEGLVSHNSTPALDQFGLDGFIYIPSSPWQRIGLFHDKYQQAIERTEEGAPAYPEMMMVQLTSWDPYVDWERAHEIEMWPGGPRFQRLRNAIQAYDDQMRQIERANPETFAVERRSHFAAVLDAYLNPQRIAEMWAPWPSGADALTMQVKGALGTTYRAHADPSKSGANFGFAMGHIAGRDERGYPHVVFDVIRHWAPADFPNHEVDYDVITDALKDYLDDFMPSEMTFDQFNSVSTIQTLQRHTLARRYPKRVSVYERSATGPLNWKTYETFKTALGLGLVHAPYYELADLELTFLQDLGGKVDHPTSGPVQTKDVADCLAIVVYELIGDEITSMIGETLSQIGVRGSAQGGFDPYRREREDADVHAQLSAATMRRGRYSYAPRPRR